MAGFQNVLIVEDEYMIRELYYLTFTKAGYTTEVAGDGAQTFAKLKDFHPDIIFLDIMLPGISGIDILKKLRNDPQYGCQTTKVVLITNLGQQNLAEIAMTEHADGYVIKADIVPKDLLTVLKSLESESSESAASSTTPQPPLK